MKSYRPGDLATVDGGQLGIAMRESPGYSAKQDIVGNLRSKAICLVVATTVSDVDRFRAKSRASVPLEFCLVCANGTYGWVCSKFLEDL